MKIQEHLTHMQNHQNYAICISELKQADACCSNQKSGKMSQNHLALFYLLIYDTPPNSFDLLMRKEGLK